MEKSVETQEIRDRSVQHGVVNEEKKFNEEWKREQKFKGFLIEVKTHEEDTQQVDDKKIGFKGFQLVLPLLKLWKQEHQIYGIHEFNYSLIENENYFFKDNAMGDTTESNSKKETHSRTSDGTS